jgi:hypothetical protein
MRFTGVMQICRRILMVLLLAALIVWGAAAPLVWILRDGLGPDMVESGWARSVFKFLVGWGTPAIVLAAPLFALVRLERRLGTTTDDGPADGTSPRSR